MNGPKCGDIIYFLEEGFNRLHGDALSTTEGYFGTSVSPIFVAAGPGVKSGYKMERQIREVDLAPTIAAIMGVRLPAQALSLIHISARKPAILSSSDSNCLQSPATVSYTHLFSFSFFRHPPINLDSYKLLPLSYHCFFT